MNVASKAESAIVPAMQKIYEFRGPLPLSCFDEANAQWYEDMVRSRESEKWSREAMLKSFPSLGLELHMNDEEKSILSEMAKILAERDDLRAEVIRLSETKSNDTP